LTGPKRRGNEHNTGNIEVVCALEHKRCDRRPHAVTHNVERLLGVLGLNGLSHGKRIVNYGGGAWPPTTAFGATKPPLVKGVNADRSLIQYRRGGVKAAGMVIKAMNAEHDYLGGLVVLRRPVTQWQLGAINHLDRWRGWCWIAGWLALLGTTADDYQQT
jgi:hypothetical protein